MELDSPQQWRLKGEGNANLVFSYSGDLPHLVRGAANRAPLPGGRPQPPACLPPRRTHRPLNQTRRATPPPFADGQGATCAQASEEADLH